VTTAPCMRGVKQMEGSVGQIPVAPIKDSCRMALARIVKPTVENKMKKLVHQTSALTHQEREISWMEHVDPARNLLNQPVEVPAMVSIVNAGLRIVLRSRSC